jgi:DNA-binding response OmpR family regulator
MEILAVLDDLLFSSKISGALSSGGHAVRIVADPSAALNQIETQKPSVVIVDLGLQRGDPYELIRKLKTDSGVPVLAYTHHMDTAGREKALEAGATKVVSRSQFIGEMESLVDGIASK